MSIDNWVEDHWAVHDTAHHPWGAEKGTSFDAVSTTRASHTASAVDRSELPPVCPEAEASRVVKYNGLDKRHIFAHGVGAATSGGDSLFAATLNELTYDTPALGKSKVQEHLWSGHKGNDFHVSTDAEAPKKSLLDTKRAEWAAERGADAYATVSEQTLGATARATDFATSAARKNIPDDWQVGRAASGPCARSFDAPHNTTRLRK